VKRIAILGSTGSIGTQTIQVVGQHPDRLQVVALAAGSNHVRLMQQAREHDVRKVATFEPTPDPSIPSGIGAISELAQDPEVDLVVVAVAGVIGLVPTLAAIRAGKEVALASKEVLVAAGELVMPEVRARGVTLTPIDSEHSAILQCLQGARRDSVERIYITSSGGPFRGYNRDQLAKVTRAQALDHPTWRMGGKITIDSATLMNKGLEIIEAKWLFDLPLSRIEVVVHPQSIVHSLVRFVDGSVLGQMGLPDMRLPIQYALLYPDRVPNAFPAWNPMEGATLTFEQPDHEAFPAIRLARQAEAMGGTAPCVLNAANEEAVHAFLRGEFAFIEIVERVEEALSRHQPVEATLDNLLQADAWARETVGARSLLH
jgi:1-deoxy-D-xylulose-5-phosphate reductoisomerase